MLFDIGGVLADFAGLAAMTALDGSLSPADTAARWLLSPWVRRFEAGDCDPVDFATGVISEWGLPFTADEYLTLFRGWLHDPFPGAEQLVHDTADQVAVGCLSNTNALHWQDKISKWPLTRRFAYRLLSYELGVVKPDAEIFELALAIVGVAPDRILFLDDNPLNVEGARAVGLNAEQTRSVSESRALLRRYGVIRSTGPRPQREGS